jgi:hypothetical protein
MITDLHFSVDIGTQTPYYFQGGVVGAAAGYHVGVQHIDTFVELFSGGVSEAALEALRSPDA